MALVCCPHCGHASRDAEFCDACNREIGDGGVTSTQAPTQIDLGDGQIVQCPFLQAGWPESERLEPFEVAWDKPRRGRLYAISPRSWPNVRDRVEERRSVQSPALPPITVVPADEGAIVLVEWWDRGRPLVECSSSSALSEPFVGLREVIERCKIYGGLMSALHALGFVWLNFDPDAVESQNGSVRITNLDTGLFRSGECPSQLKISLQYSPPEVCRFQGERIGPATDVFHLAMFAYYAVANLLPVGFAGQGLEAFGFKIPPLRVFRPSLPVGVWPVIARGLSTDPGSRFTTVEEFLERLERAVSTAPNVERTDTRPTAVLQTVRQRRFQKVTNAVSRFARACGKHLKTSAPTDVGIADVGSLTINGAAKSALGTVNQDTIAVETISVGAGSGYLMLVADGVSVSRIGRGEIASQTAAKFISERIHNELASAAATLDWPTILEQACLEASEQILQLAQAEAKGMPGIADNDVMSTTVVIGIWDGDSLHVANVGDSRAYLVRQGVAEQLTVDGDMGTSQLAAGTPPEQVQELGVAAKSLRYCLGACALDAAGELVTNPERCRPAYSRWTLQAHDTVVFCSDGLVEEGVFLEPDEMAAIVATGDKLSAQELAEQLVDAADHRQRPPSAREPAGFGDNIACVVLRIGE